MVSWRPSATRRVLGITGVPTYIFDGQYTISGAQEVAIFARVFDQVADFASGSRRCLVNDGELTRTGAHPYRRRWPTRNACCTRMPWRLF